MRRQVFIPRPSYITEKVYDDCRDKWLCFEHDIYVWWLGEVAELNQDWSPVHSLQTPPPPPGQSPVAVRKSY